MTLLCVPIAGDDADAMLDDARAAKTAGADIVEFRVDRLFEGEGDEPGLRAALRLVREAPLPCIVTCRSASEGGEYDGDDAARLSLYEALGAADHPPRYVDLEHAVYTRSANLRQKAHLAVDHPGQLRDLRTRLILSAHDFKGRPADLTRRLAAMQAEEAAAVVKIAFRARSVRDNLEVFDLLAERVKPMIALAMGEEGLLSRVLAPKFGAFLTFASLRPGAGTAPGQPTIHDLLALYHFRGVGPATKVYGVIGFPVGHSLSPLIHNAGFRAPGVEHDGVYLPLPVPPEWEHFKATTLDLLHHPRLDFRGASVTIPHKEHLVRLAREQGWEMDALSADTGAANTIVSAGPGGPIRVMNTDGPAAAACLGRALGWLRDRRIAVIGAGGVARGVTAALVREGAVVAMHARRKEQAERLVADLRPIWDGPGARDRAEKPGKAVAAPWEKLCGSCCEAFINCTPMGMAGGPAPDASAIPEAEFDHIPQGAVLMDTVYNPVRTPMLEHALGHNLPIVDGVSMFVRQAAAQFEAWTGRDAPIALFERLTRERLASPRE